MSEEPFNKDFSPVDSARERTSLYGLGFDPASFMGFLVPGGIVFGIGAIGGYLISRFL